ncbi:MAG: bifunctional folylpolyglutamate synthase/dihydrofolate synthase [Clostridia bacterium]|nr:bifunctional folylpolyglutamate synthase/dihydrofolate synthase [Clostridia bacterium]
MTYEEALQYIHGRYQYRIKLGLDRMRYLLEKLGDPHRQYPVVHVAGTNGKGSTVMMLSAVLQKAGYKVGRYTSPHLSSYCERMVIDEKSILPERVAALVSRVKPVVEAADSRPEIGAATEFEFGTLLAFSFFAEEQVDIAVIEVGMGGRLDATNVVDPLVCVITPVGLEHREYLGDTLEAIAREKAGIIKEKRPVVTGLQEPEALAVLAGTAARAGAPFYRVGKEIRFRLQRADLTGTYLNLQWKEEPAVPVRVNLFGSHQAANAAMVFGALHLLREEGFAWRQEDLIAGLSEVRWPGRLELIPGNPSFLLDGAHNPHACRVLIQSLEELYPGARLTAVIGVQENRPVEEMAGILAPKLSRVYATRLPYFNTALPSRVAAAFRSHGIAAVEIDDPLQAVDLAKTEAYPVSPPVLITGSFYLLGEVRPHLLAGD